MEPYAGQLEFRYARSDGWCPLGWGAALHDRLGASVVSLEAAGVDEYGSGLDHAFVIGQSDLVAGILGDAMAPHIASLH